MDKIEKGNGVLKNSQKSRRQNLTWLSIVSSIFVVLGIGVYGFLYYDANKNQDLGTYNDPEVAFKETQKVLLMLSTHLNTGIESVEYVKDYDNSKDLIFK